MNWTPVRSLTLTGLVMAAVSVNATVWNINANLSGLNEVPPNASPASGTVVGTFDDVTNLLMIDTNASNFVASVTAAHIHEAAAGINGPVRVTLSGTTGGLTYFSHDMPVLSAALETALFAGNLYVNVHSTTFPGGEVRGQLIASLPTRPVSGTITLEDWLGAVPGVTIVVEIRSVGSTSPLETHVTSLGAGGAFTVQSGLPTGNYDVAIKGPRWLRKVAANRTLGAGGMSGVNLSLTNADEDGDNEIGIGDYALLSANFGSAGPVGDVNGDDEVDIADFAIMSANFGMFGDD